MAQELFPHRISTVSSIIMGFGWGVGGLLVTPLGSIADKIGLQNALYLLNGFGLIGIIAAILLPGTNQNRIL